MDKTALYLAYFTVYSLIMLFIVKEDIIFVFVICASGYA